MVELLVVICKFQFAFGLFPFFLLTAERYIPPQRYDLALLVPFLPFSRSYLSSSLTPQTNKMHRSRTCSDRTTGDTAYSDIARSERRRTSVSPHPPLLSPPAEVAAAGQPRHQDPRVLSESSPKISIKISMAEGRRMTVHND